MLTWQLGGEKLNFKKLTFIYTLRKIVKIYAFF